ncbi:scavenger receptor class B member 1 isoform X2 [Teleopsis dalmanni]|uniref:scavenger receptor class B member 1 isoform X2 n=1 Tax=Teleopsis dalmanni TaxID=139649 RepID=UPI0018CFB04E|nr:scavenger receptor class B member 1 isoform X2 [Teleopsis dalmanni]
MTVRRRLRRNSLKDFLAYGAKKFESFYPRRFSVDLKKSAERFPWSTQKFDKSAFLLLAIGVLAISTAVLVKIFQPYDLIFKWKLIMSENGEIFNLWAKPPVDLYCKIYLFNVTNADAFLAGREKLNVQQVGPYVYKELMTHENITFNENNTMSTIPQHPLVWQEHLSEGNKEDDPVVMVNIAMLAISHITSKKTSFHRYGLNKLLDSTNSKPLVRMTAREFMFDYKSSLITIGNTFLSNWIYFEKVGLIDRMYDFGGDYETFHTGIPDVSISGLYATYRGSENLAQWKGEHCSNIGNASDGTKFKSFLQPNDTIKFFRKSMCRPINLHRVGEEKKYGSLTGYKYVFEENAFDNGAINPDNKCFCRQGKCQPSGLIDVTDCYYGFPISLSYPHFMEGDPDLQNNITGLTPSKEAHSSQFIIQPQSGLPLSISAKIQINMHFNDLRNIKKAERFSYLTVPMVWFDIMLPELPESLDNRFNFYLNILPYLDIIGIWGSLALGVVLLVYAVTRATLRISKISENTKYCKANILHSTTTQDNSHRPNGSVYNPCEMALIEMNEKDALKPLSKQQKHLITRSDEENIADADYELYNEIDMKKRRQSYALDLEPAISDTDEGNESDAGTFSHTSTTSSSVDENECTTKCVKNDNQGTLSSDSSGFAPSISNLNNSDTLLSWPISTTSPLADVGASDISYSNELVSRHEATEHHPKSLNPTSSFVASTSASASASAPVQSRSTSTFDV